MEGGDRDLRHSTSPKLKLKVLNTDQKETQVLNCAILLSVLKRILFPRKPFYNIDILPLNLSNLCMRQKPVTVNQLVCTFLLLCKAASRNLARSGCSASDLALHEAACRISFQTPAPSVSVLISGLGERGFEDQ